MLVGYVRSLSKKESLGEAIDKLEKNGVEELFEENTKNSHLNINMRPEFSQLLNYLQRDDTLVLISLEHLSREYTVLIDVLVEFEQKCINLKILNMPEVSLSKILKVLMWVENNERKLGPTVNRFKIQKETGLDLEKYHFRSKNPEYRQKYWRVIEELISGNNIRKIAKKVDVSKGTVYRIKKQYGKFKQAIILVGMFFITIASLKIAQSYSTKLWSQIVICGIMAITIVYFSYNEHRDE